MESRENPLFGRKVFFINPSIIIESFLIDNLRKNEYEVYIIRDYRKAKNVLSKFSDSMCFVNIDSELSFSQWFNFMKSFSVSDNLSSIYLGIVSELAGLEDKDKFMMNLRLPGGFNMISKNEKSINRFMAILDLNGAKGRRKYLRLDTRENKDISGYMTFEGKLYAISLKDLSSAGFAITYKDTIVSLFQKNTLIRNLCISVGRKSMVCSCIVFNTQPVASGTAMSVLMLTNENPETTKTYIRNYIFEKLDEEMNAVINTSETESLNYIEPDEYSSLKVIHDSSLDELEPLTEIECENDEAVSIPGHNYDDDIL